MPRLACPAASIRQQLDGASTTAVVAVTRPQPIQRPAQSRIAARRKAIFRTQAPRRGHQPRIKRDLG